MTVFDRTMGLGASEAASALGLDPYRSPTDLWMEKTGRGIATETNLAMRLGNLLEEPVAILYAELSGQVVRRHKRACAACRKASTEYACERSAVFDSEYPFLFAHLDRITKPDGQSWRVLEIKTSGWPGEDWGPTNTDRIPLRVLIQVMLQMRLAGYEDADVAALLWGRELRTYSIHRDPDLERETITELVRFWDHVQRADPPVEVDHPHTGAALRRLYPTDDDNVIAVTTEADWDLVSEVVTAYRAWKHADGAYKAASVAMQARLGEAAGMDWDGGKITWKAVTRHKTDWRPVAQWVGSLAVEYGVVGPEEWEQFVSDQTQTETTRTFRVTTKKRGTNDNGGE